MPHPLRRLKQPLLTASCWLAAQALRPWSRPRPLPSAPARAVIVRPCCLGDVLLTTAAVRALAEALPLLRLDYLTMRAAGAGLVNSPRLTSVLDLTPGLAGYLVAVRLLRARRYDMAIILDRGPQWSLLALLAGIPVRAGLDSLWRGLGLTHRVRPQTGQHEAALAMAVVGSLGLPIGSLAEEYRPTAMAQARIAALLAGRQADRPAVVLHPGGAVNPGMTLLAKRWPPERFAELIGRLTRAGAWPIVTGGSGDRAAVDAVLAAVPAGQPPPLDLCGQLDLDAHAALAAAAALYIGHDSGPTHLAAAAGAPTVVIFGPTDPRVYAPPGAHVRPVWRGARLDPAIDLRDRVVDPTAILAVTVDDVWAAVAALAPSLAGVTQQGEAS